MVLAIINPHDPEPADYTDRKTAKAVIFNDQGQILLFPSALLGGGVEEGESYEDALHREVLEEAGIQVEIVCSLGEIIGYRDTSKRKYLVQGYLCTYLQTLSAPTTTDPDELAVIATWQQPEETIQRLEKEIQMLEALSPEQHSPNHQSRLHNRQMTLVFIREAIVSQGSLL